MQSLVAAVAALAAARHLEDVTRIVRQTARALTHADGVTFVLREGTDCFYADENAIAPLWKGKRFPMEACISGWAMQNREPAAIPDIYLDPRIPHDAYRPTFVKSLLMMPVGEQDPVAAIGVYWATQHEATQDERDTLQALANAAGLALANVHLNARLESTLERERDARRAAEAAAKVKDEFLAAVSHELRTPLHVIQNWIWQLKQAPEVERALRRPLEIIERNTELQARLIEDLLDVSQSTHGKLHVQTQLVDLGQVSGLVVEQCQMAAQAKHILLEFTRTPSTHIWGDPIRLQQVLWNVLNNAIKFTPENGRVQVRVNRGTRHACITVEDSGIGVEPQFLPRMFERFTQADRTPTRRFGGLGVGLSIVKDIVTLHGGSVRADSRGTFQGTSITMEFPIPALMDQPGMWLGETVPRQRSAESLSGIEILLVDDDIDTLTAVESVLRHHGANVIRAGSVPEALALLEQRAPTLLISDLSMPELNGLDLIKQVRGLAAPHGRLPAAVLSAHAASEHATNASEAGFQLYIEKPVLPDVFVGHIATLAGRH